MRDVNFTNKKFKEYKNNSNHNLYKKTKTKMNTYQNSRNNYNWLDSNYWTVNCNYQIKLFRFVA